MSWRFRRIFRFGPFRTTMGKSGLGYSIGIRGLRFGISPDGKKYISIGIPGTGFYWIKYFNNSSSEKHVSKETEIQSVNSKANVSIPWWKQKDI